MERGLSAPTSRGALEIKICRLCLGRTPVVFSLLDEKIEEMLGAVAAVQVSSTDSVSTECCLKCLLNLKLAYRIRLRMATAESTLRNEVVKVKQEEVYVSDVLEPNVCVHEDSEGSSLSPASEEEYDDDDYGDVQLSGEEALGPRCSLCTKTFDGFSSYDSHFSECALEGKDKIAGIVQAIGKARKAKAAASAKKKPSKAKKGTVMLANNKPTVKPPLVGVIATAEGKYRCEICEKEYTFRAECRKHWYQIHKTSACPICSKVVTHSNLHTHMDTHATGAEKICELCGRTFKNKHGLRSHMYCSHGGYRYSCEKCGKAYKRGQLLRRHLNREHNDDPGQYICDICGKKYKDPTWLRNHISKVHHRKREFRCKYCNKNFSGQYSLKTHIRQHTNETPYRCSVCGEGFKQNVSLKTHLKSKHGIEEKKDVPCKVCDKVFATRHAVISHMKLHNV